MTKHLPELCLSDHVMPGADYDAPFMELAETPFFPADLGLVQWYSPGI